MTVVGASECIKGSVVWRARAGWEEVGGFEFVPADMFSTTGHIWSPAWMTACGDAVKGLWEMETWSSW